MSDIIPDDPNVLKIESDALCNSIKEKNWVGIFVGNGFCDDMEGDLNISGYENLEWIIMESNNKTNTISNLNSLKITNNPKLQSIIIQDGNYQHSALFRVQSVVIKGN